MLTNLATSDSIFIYDKLKPNDSTWHKSTLEFYKDGKCTSMFRAVETDGNKNFLWAFDKQRKKIIITPQDDKKPFFINYLSDDVLVGTWY